MKKYHLIEAVGRIITAEEFPTKEAAQEEMAIRLERAVSCLKAWNKVYLPVVSDSTPDSAWAGRELNSEVLVIWSWKIIELEAGDIIPDGTSFGCYRGSTTDEDLALAQKLVDEDNSIIAHLMEEMGSDDADNSGRLVYLYQNVNEDVRSVLDYAMTCLCGYTLGTIIKHLNEK